MPPASRISQLPGDIRQWLEYTLEASGFHYYREITDELNQKLKEAGFDGNLSAETVRRHGAKAAAKIDLRDNLIGHIRQELDPGRNIPPADWNRAVVSAIGFFNYRTLTDLQCQEMVTVKEHAAFVRSLIQTHNYEKMLAVSPLTLEEVPEVRAVTGIEAASAPVPPENTEKHTTLPGPEAVMNWEGVPRHLRRQIVRTVSELNAKPQDTELRRKLDSLLAAADRCLQSNEAGGEKRAA